MSDPEKFEKITKEMVDLYKRKNADYGGSITDTYNRYGDVSFRTRIRDKLNRWDSLSEKKSQVTDEKIRDTLMDLANYSILAIIEMEREK